MSAVLAPVRPGARFGARPERRVEPAGSPLEAFLQGRLVARLSAPPTFRRAAPWLARVRAVAAELRAADERRRRRRRHAALDALRAAEPTADDVITAFAHIVVECEALFGITLHDEQLYAGRAMLHGSLVEMRTGEGKTLAAALPAIVVALGGAPVHVVTANDYLAARDAEALRPLYERFGLTLASVTQSSSETARADAYGSDVVYASAKQVVFDYLRDRRSTGDEGRGLGERLGPLIGSRRASALQRGLCCAIVDEADSVLVDEARTPLVLSEADGRDPALRARVAVALAIARGLHADVDYRLAERSVRLSVDGRKAVDRQTRRLGGVWRLARYRHELVRQALAALHLYRAEHDYLVRDGRVVLIDAQSGRPQPDHKLRHGLHQMLEVKEGCEPSGADEVVAALSFQRFFARYHHLCGMSGTLAEARGELATVYRLPLRTVPTHRPCRLIRLPDTVAPDEDRRFELLAARVRDCRAAGRPVLLGTRTLALAERLSARLDAAGIAHRRLDARHDAEEARVIATAGEPGAVTLATNMAGRGSDIPLAAAAREAGGLHVVELEASDSPRVTRQLFGRAARQGDPGSCESLLCLEDDALSAVTAVWQLDLLRRVLERWPRLARRPAVLLFAFARHRVAARHARERMTLFHRTEQELRQLAVSGTNN